MFVCCSACTVASLSLLHVPFARLAHVASHVQCLPSVRLHHAERRPSPVNGGAMCGYLPAVWWVHHCQGQNPGLVGVDLLVHAVFVAYPWSRCERVQFGGL